MTSDQPFLPYGRHLIEEDDVAAVTATLKGDFLTTGPATTAFEEALAGKTGADHAVVCSSGTAALHLAALALDIGPGDVAIVPSVTFLATANAVRYVGADVVFADVDSETGLMRPDDFVAAIERSPTRVRAVFPVHLAGQSPDMPAIAEIARKNNIAIAEDACHALGSTYPGENGQAQVGGCLHSDIAAFSFHPVKTVAMGEGGALTTNDEKLAKRLKRLCSHGMIRQPEDFVDKAMAFDETGAANPWYYEMQEMGFNFRASDIHCALGLSQLNKFERFSERRKNLAHRYDQALKPLAQLLRPLARMPGCDPVWHLYVVLIDFAAAGISRAELMRLLRDKGIGSQVHYIPVHRQPYYRQRHGDIPLAGAERYYEQCLSLPLFPGMADGDVGRVVDVLSEIFHQASRARRNHS